jgi:hypothetical protein
VKGFVLPFHCISELLPHRPQTQADEVPITRTGDDDATASQQLLLLRHRSRTPGCRPLQAVLLTHLREARQPWRQQDRSFVACRIAFEGCGGGGGGETPPLVLETYANDEDPAGQQESQLDGLTAMGFVPRSLFGVRTRVAACLSVWSADRRLSDLVRYCHQAARCLLLRNAAGTLATLGGESERAAVIRVLDRGESNTFRCILKLNRQAVIFFIKYHI